jgi:hypothetical protein
LQIQIIGAKTVLLEHGVVVHHLCTVNGHKYSSPSILRYIFHIKPLFSKKLLSSHFYTDLIIFAPEEAEIFKNYLFILA